MANKNKSKNKSKWSVHSETEQWYAKQLKKVADQSGEITDNHVGEDGLISNIASYKNDMTAYAKSIAPWAETVGGKMVSTTGQMNLDAWKDVSNDIYSMLSERMNSRDYEQFIDDMTERQVGLITSIPEDAAERAIKISQDAFTGGRRASDAARDIAETTGVSESRANLIARTEISTTNTAWTQKNAEEADSKQFYWRTMEDGSVRESHQEVADKAYDWDDPPEVDDLGAYLPGQCPNCRCYPEPIFEGINDAKK